MGYYRKHKNDIRSAVELITVLFFTIGIAPTLMLLASFSH